MMPEQFDNIMVAVVEMVAVSDSGGYDCVFVVVLHPNNIYGHIRTGTDLRQCTLMVTL